MYSPVQLTIKYLHYWLTGSNGKGHGIHSPFVFDFVQHVLNGRGDKPLYDQLQEMRKELLKNDNSITVEDFGAGSRVIGSKQRKISQVAKTSLKPRKYSQLLHRIARHYQPNTILELGTSLGITTAHLAAAHPSAKVVTMEGSAAIAAIATRNFAITGLQNIELVPGNFDDTLPSTLSSLPPIDLAFIDGNHRFKPTINYFQQIVNSSNDSCIIILDDIYWSKEMQQAWQWVKDYDAVRLTIDLFAIGIAVLRPGILHKQHFRIRY